MCRRRSGCRDTPRPVMRCPRISWIAHAVVRVTGRAAFNRVEPCVDTRRVAGDACSDDGQEIGLGKAGEASRRLSELTGQASGGRRDAGKRAHAEALAAVLEGAQGLKGGL